MSSIRSRLITGLLVGFCLLGGAGVLVLHVAIRKALTKEFDQVLQAKANALAAMTRVEKGSIDLDYSKEFMPEFTVSKSPDYFQMWLPDGRCVLRSSSLRHSELLHPTISTRAPEFWNMRLPDGSNGRAYIMRFIPDDQEGAENMAGSLPSTEVSPVKPAKQEMILLVVARQRSELDHRLHALGTVLLLVGGVFIVAAVVLVALTVRKGLAPLLALGEQTAAIDATSLSMRFPEENMPRELRPICSHLNDLLARLETSFHRERQFSADVAHELRTPIAELRTWTEVALKWPGDSEATTRTLRKTLDAALQMESLIGRLFALARCEVGLEMVDYQIVDFVEFLKNSWVVLDKEAQRKGLQLHWTLPTKLQLKTDAAILRSIVVNLLTNAVEYCPAGGVIEMKLKSVGAEFDLEISNSVENLNPSDIPHFFERFWRKDSARTSSSHFGLGLPLSKEFAHLLGFTLRARLDEPQKICFLLSGSLVCKSGQTPTCATQRDLTFSTNREAQKECRI